ILAKVGIETAYGLTSCTRMENGNLRNVIDVLKQTGIIRREPDHLGSASSWNQKSRAYHSLCRVDEFMTGRCGSLNHYLEKITVPPVVGVYIGDIVTTGAVEAHIASLSRTAISARPQVSKPFIRKPISYLLSVIAAAVINDDQL